eukprot:gene32709-36932_t
MSSGIAPVFKGLVSHPWAYPALEAVHIVGIAMLFGGLLVFELRALGLGALDAAFDERLARQPDAVLFDVVQDRTVGALLGKAQRYVSDVKAEVNRSMELDELKKMKDTVENAARDVHNTIQTSASEFEKDWNEAIDSSSNADLREQA